MNRCKTCKHWKQEENPEKDRWFKTVDFDYGECNTHWGPDILPSKSNEMTAHPGRGGDIAFLTTGQDFGCVLHQPAEDAATIML